MPCFTAMRAEIALMSGSAFAVTHHAFSSGAGRTSDGNGSHASTLKSPSYTKSVSWQHYQRLEVVNHYFTTDDGYRIISARFGVPRTQVRTWVALYEKHGEKGLIPKPKGVSADPELRIKVVKAVIEQHMSLNQAAAHFMLAGSGSVARWLKVYEERGEAGLRALKIGTKRNIAISVDPEKAASALELSKDRRIEDLERQVRFLETRLMYLKKLKALAHPTKK
ncbi:putative transposase [Shigella flexneri K-272]|nr:putative transposase [Shigella flexneri K-272]